MMTKGSKIDLLCDALIEDILSTSDEEIVSETSREEIEKVRHALARAEENIGRGRLAAAKAGLEAWRRTDRRTLDAAGRAANRDRFDRLRAGDAAFQRKMTLAARNGEAPTDDDLSGLADDYAEVRRLEEDKD
jgi:hypothetical protein